MGFLDSLTGADKAREEARKARQDIKKGQKTADNALATAYGTQTGLNQPVADLYGQYMPQLQGAISQPNAAQGNIDQIAGMQAPTLRNDVQFDVQNDPIFLQQRDEMLKQLNRRYSATGQYGSSDADNAVIRNMLPFMQDSYGRGVDNLNRSNQNALTTYGLDAERYGNLYGMNNQMNEQNYNRLGGMVNLGLGGINSLSGAAQTYGNNRAGVATRAANALADNRYSLGQLATTMSPLNTISSMASTGAKLYGAFSGMGGGGGGFQQLSLGSANQQ